MPSPTPAAHVAAFSAIPTKWNGVQFRSRLEARWAAFFTLLGWEWHYEPFDLEGYIPDFILPFSRRAGGTDVLVEVKPFVNTADPLVAATAAKIIGTSWGYQRALIVGAAPFYEPMTFRVGAFTSDYDAPYSEGETRPDDTAFVDVCESNQEPLHYCLDRQDGWWDCAVCGMHKNSGRSAGHEVEAMWLEAGNQVQWRSPRR